MGKTLSLNCTHVTRLTYFALRTLLHDVLISRYLCPISVVYEGDVDNNEEEEEEEAEEALRIEEESKMNTDDRYKQHTQSEVSDVVQPQGKISSGNKGSEVLEQVGKSQRLPTAVDTASSTASRHSLRNQQGSYAPRDILLIPGSNTLMNNSGVLKKFPEDSTNENRDTKIETENIKV
jgi:hypothetical protein